MSVVKRKTSWVDSTDKICMISTAIFILIVVIVGLLVQFLVPERSVRTIVLICLIVLLLIVGVTSIVILHIRKKNIVRQAKRQNGTMLRQNIQYSTAPTAPPGTHSSGWSYSEDYTKRTTVQA